MSDDYEDAGAEPNLYVKYPELMYQMGNFEFIPSKFHGLVTKDFGMMSNKYDKDGNLLKDIKPHPYLELKDIAKNKSIDTSDRMLAVRYMCFIPYLNGEPHLNEAVDSIVFDDSIDIYKRFQFFSNNEKYSRLNDSIVHRTHELFFSKGIDTYPFELLILSARYILSFYFSEDDKRQTVLNWLIDVADDKNETHRCRAEAADVLITCGEPDETAFGYSIISQIGNKQNVYIDEENVHNDSFIQSTKNIIRSLQKEVITTKEMETGQISSTDEIYTMLSHSLNEEDKEIVRKFFFRLQTDPTKFQRLNLLEILHLIWSKIKKMDPLSKEEACRRLVQEAKDANGTCFTGFLIRLMNSLQGLVTGEEFNLKIDPKEEIKAAVFARLNADLRSLGEVEREGILESMNTGGILVQNFVTIFSPKEDLWDEYKNILDQGVFDIFVEDALKNYIGN
jgi:hypothetical protein